ncbi:hypothetical protein A7A76_18075 [Lysobacter enzymogenes]|uniref:putative signal transducing protein n=1 Tax=Lysobacter enzymogenes TaxID=69 RepID=UPI0019CF89F0|nr:DUF2007 domain-containing protein [Lysobacter enzymogenes]MBN7136663.1 hypothetical protein [Lysobacter enzymogenes]
MQIVYQAAHSADAQLVRGLLAREGIRSFVFGGALEGGAGLLPVGGSVRVEVADEDVERARAIIEQWQAAEVPLSDDDDEPDRDYGDDATPEHVEDANLYRPLNARKPVAGGFGMAGIVFALVVGALAGALATGAALRPTASAQNVDYDADGIADARLSYEDDRLVRSDNDRNSDGTVDLVTVYDGNGLATSIEEDQDFDGVRETVSTLAKGLLATRSADYDGDGVPERQENYLRGVLHTVEWLDKQGRAIKRDTYTGGRLSGGEIDHDRDGALDTARVYDERGEVRSSKPLTAD